MQKITPSWNAFVGIDLSSGPSTITLTIFYGPAETSRNSISTTLDSCLDQLELDVGAGNGDGNNAKTRKISMDHRCLAAKTTKTIGIETTTTNKKTTTMPTNKIRKHYGPR